MRIVVAGGRDFEDYDFMDAILKFMVMVHGNNAWFITGGARGADTVAERWTSNNGHACKVIPAEWDKHGKAAGPIRNKQMADEGDVLVAFWNGTSKGTKNMIDTALKQGLEVHVFRYE